MLEAGAAVLAASVDGACIDAAVPDIHAEGRSLKTPTPILFDIDGTLVLTGGAGGRALTSAFEELFAIPDAFRGIPVPGRTDAWILSQAITAHGIPPESATLACFPEVYLRHLTIEVEQDGPRKSVMPGVR